MSEEKTEAMDAPSIPKPRFDSVLSRAKEAEAALAALQLQHKELQQQAKGWQRDAEIVGELRQERDSLTEQLGAQKQTSQAHMDMLAQGISDPEVREYVWHRFGKQEGDAQPWADWWAEQREAPSAVLRPFFAEQQATPATTEPGAPQSAPEKAIAAPRSNAMAAPTPPAPQAYTPGSIASLPREQRKAAIQAALGNGVGWPFS